jgi:hypothetical protein
MSTPTWQSLATKKRDSITALIPKEWILPSIPTVEEQKDVTGEYIWQFLSPKEKEITETDAVGIVEKTKSGKWSAVEVTKAFCHRAAIAHQLARTLPLHHCLVMEETNKAYRQIAFTRSSSMPPLKTPKVLMLCTQHKSLLELSTVSP